MTPEERAAQVTLWPMSAGKVTYLAQLKGKALTRGQAMRAKCAECCGGYKDGKVDCGVTLCPLYPFMPYRKKEK